MQYNLSVFFDRSVALFSLGTLVYSINKTDRHTINETLLKVVLKHTPHHINVLGNYISHIRLYGGSKPSEGVIEVFNNGEWDLVL